MKKNDGNRSIIARARDVLNIESQAIKDQYKHINNGFVNSVQLLYQIGQRGGQVVVMGIGKSGIVGRKIAATFSSTGTPSIFFHPSEGLHGDLGMIQPRDGVLVLSSSGETDEIKKILPILKDKTDTIIAMTSKKTSRLGRAANEIILTSVRKEACPLNLAPTASTTAMLALGDALAMALMEKKNFKPTDFAKLHPGGSLGKKLYLKVQDLMHEGRENPVVKSHQSVRDALFIMTRTKLGAANIVDSKGRLVGFFTDGDLRRKLQKDSNVLSAGLAQVMTKNPCTISPDKTLYEALHLLKDKGFDNLPVVNGQGKPVGILDERDLLAEGIV